MPGKDRCLPSSTRVVTYTFAARNGGAFDEVAVERLLLRAKAGGVVTAYDTGRGLSGWMNGPPGAALRAVRRAVDNQMREAT